MEASIAPPIKLTANRNEHNPSVQSRKRLPLKMIISELASRDTNTVETEPAHQSIPSHIDNVSMCTAPIKKRCPGRYFDSLDCLKFSTHVEQLKYICSHMPHSMLIVLSSSSSLSLSNRTFYASLLLSPFLISTTFLNLGSISIFGLTPFGSLCSVKLTPYL